METELAIAEETAAARTTRRLPNFRALLGEDAWARLPIAVQRRFDLRAHTASDTLYSGRMDVRASQLGVAFAHCCRVLGTPVAPFTGADVTMQVAVFESAHGIVWERRYDFHGRAPIVVRSTKQLDSEGCLIEALGAGLRMRLRVYEERGALHFISTGYYFEALGIRQTLPEWFLPGVTHVIHEDLGAGRFRFTMSTDHRWFGQDYFQQGVFC